MRAVIRSVAVATVVLTGSAYAGDITTSATYTGEVLRNVAGGVRRATVYLGNLDVDAQWHPGNNEHLTTYVHLLVDHGEKPSDFVGDAQGVSNIAAPDAMRVYEAWVDYNVGMFGVRAGVYDLNTEFDVTPDGGLFSNSSFGITPEFSQGGPLGPSIFPYTGLAVRARTESDGNYLQFAVLDGMPGDKKDPRKPNFHLSKQEGVLLVSEVGRAAKTQSGSEYKIAAGVWHFTADFERIKSGASQQGNSGAYALADGVIGQWETASLSGFLQVGIADDRVNGIANYVGAGLVVSGFLNSRPKDRVGLALARAKFSDDARDADGLLSAETAIELNYEMPINEWFTLQPNVQRVIHPSGDPSLKNAWAIGARFILSYSN